MGDEQQMTFNFSDGGMMDDGMNVEPTTGNEIPPGSTAEEVADTVDAKLSVGEYVLPADVVQYYGLEKIEKMVQKAKQGLGEMEQNDRIKAPGDEEDLPFDDEELMSEDGSEDDGEEMAFAAGGFLGGPNSGIQMVDYTGPGGDTISVMFVNGLPVQQVPAGYVPAGQANPNAAPVFQSSRSNAEATSGMIPSKSDNRDDGRTGLDKKRTTPSMWDIEDFENYLDQETVTKVMSGALGLANPLIGGAIARGYRMTGQEALKEIDRRLELPDLDEQSKTRLEAVRKQYEDMNSDSGGSGLMGGLLPEGGLLGGLMRGENPFEGITNMFAPKAQTPAAPATVNTGSSAPRSTSTARATTNRSTSTQDERNNDLRPKTGTTTVKSGASVTNLPSGQRTATSRGKTTALSSKSQQSNPGGYDSDKGSWGVGPMAEGGFVTRRKK